MENWQDNLIEWFNNLQTEVRSFSDNLNQELEKSTKEIEKNITQVTEELETIFNSELNQFIEEIDYLVNDFFAIFREEYQERDYITDEEIEEELASLLEDYKAKPNPKKHPACVGCINYHGQTYNGNLLVCGIHPYGWEGKECPDWEDETRRLNDQD